MQNRSCLSSILILKETTFCLQYIIFLLARMLKGLRLFALLLPISCEFPMWYCFTLRLFGHQTRLTHLSKAEMYNKKKNTNAEQRHITFACATVLQFLGTKQNATSNGFCCIHIRTTWKVKAGGAHVFNFM